MATPTPTAASSVAEAGKQRQRKPIPKAQREKMAAALKRWRESLTPEAKEELRQRTRETQRQRWLNMSERERRDALAGVMAWQREQRKAKRDAARAKAAAEPKAGAKGRARKPASITSAGPELPRTAEAVEDALADILDVPRKARTRTGATK